MGIYNAVFVEPWPWWVAGLALGSFIAFYGWVYNRLMGMSSAVENALQEWRDPILPKHQPAVVGLEAALAMMQAQKAGGPGGLVPPPAEGEKKAAAPVVYSPRFLVGGVLLGAITAGVLSGQSVMFSPGASFDALFGTNTWLQAGVLAGGGFLAGFGARMAGGCPSGHALGGLSVLSPASLLAVVGYFLAGVPLTFLLRSLS